jgi:hypothetical protein
MYVEKECERGILLYRQGCGAGREMLTAERGLDQAGKVP